MVLEVVLVIAVVVVDVVVVIAILIYFREIAWHYHIYFSHGDSYSGERLRLLRALRMLHSIITTNSLRLRNLRPCHLRQTTPVILWRHNFLLRLRDFIVPVSHDFGSFGSILPLVTHDFVIRGIKKQLIKI